MSVLALNVHDGLLLHRHRSSCDCWYVIPRSDHMFHYQAFSTPAGEVGALTPSCSRKKKTLRLGYEQDLVLQMPRRDTDQSGLSRLIKRAYLLLLRGCVGESGTEEVHHSSSPEPEGQVRVLPSSAATQSLPLKLCLFI